jgi:hypothetical protein
MQKLGFGSHSTVWLAQKTDPSEAFVALNITMSKDGVTREAAMLEAASKVQMSSSFYLYFPPRKIPPYLLISSLRVIRLLPTIRTSPVPKLSLKQYCLISGMVSLLFAYSLPMRTALWSYPLQRTKQGRYL